jgi:Domain of unknown function (DUF4350)
MSVTGATATAAGSTSTAGGRTGGRARGARILPWVGALVGAIVLVLLIGAPSPGAPLSPRSTAPEGLRGLVLFLEELGAVVEVSRDRPSSDDDVALVIGDNLGEERREEVRSWVSGGGVLVVADAGSPLAAPTAETDFSFGLVDRGDCDVGAFEDAETIDVSGAPAFDAPSALFELPETATGCFGDGDEALVVVDDVGDGVTISVGDADLFTNQNLDEGDNAVVAGAMLAPVDGTRVRILEAPFQERDTGLLDLIPLNVRRAFIQILIAFAIYALWRAIRLGRPVVEDQPVTVAGSELVAAVGGLLEVSDDPGRAAALLRADLRRDIGLRFGLAPGVAPEVVAEVVAQRTGADASRLHAALAAAPVTTDAELTELSRLIDAVRQEVFHGNRA